jgi:hypothetical protein
MRAGWPSAEFQEAFLANAALDPTVRVLLREITQSSDDEAPEGRKAAAASILAK